MQGEISISERKRKRLPKYKWSEVDSLQGT